MKAKTPSLRVVAAVAASFLFQAATLGYAAPTRPVPSYGVVFLQDPFYPGSVLQLTHEETDTQAHTNRSEGFQYTYGFQNGASVGAFIPVYLTNTPPSTAGASVPRIGGQGYNEIEVDGAFRFWGDAERYLGAEIGIVPAFQSDPILRNSTTNRIVLPASLLTRYGNALISVRFTFTDTWQLPAVTVSSKGLSSYRDYDDSYGFGTTVQLWPRSRFSPYFTWSETLAYSYTTGQDQNASALITSSGQNAESRSFALGISAVPWAKIPFVFSFEPDFTVLPQRMNESPWSWTARFRCAI